MITGSHNPADYNGFKICVGRDTIHGHQIQELRAIMEKNRAERSRPHAKARSPTARSSRPTSNIWSRTRARSRARKSSSTPATAPRARSPRAFQAPGRGRRPAFLRARRPLPEPPSGPDRRRRISRISSRRCARKRPTSASPSTATPIASASSTRTAAIIFGDELMVLFSRDILREKPGRDDHLRSEVEPPPLQRHRRSRRQTDHVEDRPLPHQIQDEGNRPRSPARCPAIFSSRTATSVTTTRSTPALRVFEIASRHAGPLSSLLEDLPPTRLHARDPRRLRGREEVPARRGNQAPPRAPSTRSTTSTASAWTSATAGAWCALRTRSPCSCSASRRRTLHAWRRSAPWWKPSFTPPRSRSVTRRFRPRLPLRTNLICCVASGMSTPPCARENPTLCLALYTLGRWLARVGAPN